MSADVSECLDDFFAKKDKKKKTKKSKSVFTPDDFDPVIGKPIKSKSKSLSTKSADAIAEATFKPEDTMKETSVLDDTTEKDADHKSVGEVDIKEAIPSASSGVPVEDDEWNDYVAEEEADYSGLRIQKLNIQEETPEEEEEIEYDNDGKVIETDVRVWKIPETPASLTPEPTTDVQSTKRSDESQSTNVTRDSSASPSPGPQKYITPAQRQAMKAASANARLAEIPRTLGGAPRRNPRSAPDINNQELFPTLGGRGVKVGVLGELGSNASSRGQSPFTGEEGGGGGRLFTDVSLENKWDALTRGSD